MQLLLMRHGEAKPVGIDGITRDEDRVLTEAGKTKAMEAAEGLMEYGITKFAKVYTSPFVRAVETAQIVADVFGCSDSITSTEVLQPGFSQNAVLELLSNQDKNDKVLLVAHQPDLGKFANRLLGGSPDEGMKLKAGDICAVTVDSVSIDSLGELDFLLTSKD